MGLGFLFEFWGWIAIAFVFDPATCAFWLVDFGASYSQIILAVLAHGDVGYFNVQEVGDMVSHDLHRFCFGVNKFHIFLGRFRASIWRNEIITYFL